MSESTTSTAATAAADSHPPPSGSSDGSSSVDSFVMLTSAEPTSSSGGASNATPVKKEGGEEDVGMELDNGCSSEEAKGGHSKEEGAAASSSSSSPPSSSSSRKRAASALNRSDDEDGEESDPTKCDDCGEPFAADAEPEAKEDGAEEELKESSSRVPRCLPCGHTLCTASVSAMLEADGHVHCPHGCVASDSLRLRSAKQLPVSHTVVGLLIQLKRSKKQRAEELPSTKCNLEVCDEKATIHCASCSQDLCSEHDSSVHEAAGSHLRVPIKDKAALFKALADEDTFKQTAANCKVNIQGALNVIAATGATLAKAEKGHTEVCTQLDNSVVSLVEVRSSADKIIQTMQAQTQLHKSKLEEVGACKAELPTLQREATALLQASDAEVVTSSPEFKRKMAQLKASEASACSEDSADGLKKLNESILALRKTALTVPVVQANLLDSKILSEGATALELQRLMGDIKLSDFELLYRGSRDGWTYADWKVKCLCQSNTLTLIKVAGSSAVFGALLRPSWSTTTNQWIPDSLAHSFLFSLVNVQSRPMKLKIVQPTMAALHCPNFGVYFGRYNVKLMQRGGAANTLGNEEMGMGTGDVVLDDEYERKHGLTKPTFSLAAGFLSGMPDGKFACEEVEVFAMKPQQE